MIEISKIKVLAVLTARKGSKGLPGKNTKQLGGRPLVDYTLISAKKSRLITDLIVSTDCEQTIELARLRGVDVPFVRPANLCADGSLHIEVLTHSLLHMEKKQNCTYDFIVTLQPTSPFRRAGEIDGVIKALRNSDADSAVTVCQVTSWEHLTKFSVIDDGYLRPLLPDHPNDIPRQQLIPIYRRSGSVYVTRRDTLLHKESIYGDLTLPVICDEKYSVDIDGPKDWAVAEHILSGLNEKRAEFDLND